MANALLEERVAALEAEVNALKQQLTVRKPQDTLPWYEARFGAFKDDLDYDEAMRLGREWREAQRPDYIDQDEEAA